MSSPTTSSLPCWPLEIISLLTEYPQFSQFLLAVLLLPPTSLVVCGGKQGTGIRHGHWMEAVASFWQPTVEVIYPVNHLASGGESRLHIP